MVNVVMPAEQRLMYPLAEVAAMFGRLNVRTLKRWAEQGKFPKLLKLGGCLFVLADELTTWVEERRRGKR